MKQRIGLIFLVLLIVISCNSPENKNIIHQTEQDGVVFSVIPDHTEFSVGELIRVKITLSYPQEMSVENYPSSTLQFVGFEIAHAVPVELNYNEGLITKSWTFGLYPLGTGQFDWVLPPANYWLDDSPKFINLPPISVSVSKTDNPQPTMLLEPIRGPIPLWVFGLLIFLGLSSSALVYYFLSPKFIDPSKLDPRQIVLEKLTELSSRQVQPSEGITSLMGILRFYLERCHSMEVQGLTNTQLIAALRSSTRQELANRIKEIAELFEIVSFAGYTPDNDTYEKLLTAFIGLVDKEEKND